MDYFFNDTCVQYINKLAIIMSSLTVASLQRTAKAWSRATVNDTETNDGSVDGVELERDARRVRLVPPSALLKNS